jgi:hypothetical protein
MHRWNFFNWEGGIARAVIVTKSGTKLTFGKDWYAPLFEANMVRRASKYDTVPRLNTQSLLYKILPMIYILIEGAD